MILLTTQKNQLYDIIQNVGLNPAQFEFLEIRSEYYTSEMSTKIFYKGSNWYYIFETLGENKIDVHYSIYSPVKTTLIIREHHRTWPLQIGNFVKWLENLKRESLTEDKWERLKIEINNVKLSYENDHNRFTVQEYEELQTQMGILKDRISGLELIPEQVEQINDKLDHLITFAKSLNKTDWKSLFIGTIINLIIQLSLELNIGKQIWTIIREVLATYFLTN